MSLDNGLVHRASCFCGSTAFAVKGRPVLSAYCHCTVCQRLTGSPFVYTIHFPEAAFAWTHASAHQEALSQLLAYNTHEDPTKIRYNCARCFICLCAYDSVSKEYSVWGPLMDRYKGEELDGKIIDWENIKPTAHIFYGTRLVDIDDDLAKWEGYEGKSRRLS